MSPEQKNHTEVVGPTTPHGKSQAIFDELVEVSAKLGGIPVSYEGKNSENPEETISLDIPLAALGGPWRPLEQEETADPNHIININGKPSVPVRLYSNRRGNHKSNK